MRLPTRAHAVAVSSAETGQRRHDSMRHVTCLITLRFSSPFRAVVKEPLNAISRSPFARILVRFSARRNANRIIRLRFARFLLQALPQLRPWSPCLMVPFSAIICSKTGLTADGLSLLTCADTLNFSCGILPPQSVRTHSDV